MARTESEPGHQTTFYKEGERAAFFYIRFTFQTFSVKISAMEFLNKAEENLTAAQVCFDNGLFNACANRAYYAALHAAVAALAHKGIRKDKFDHSQVRADFSGELIKRRKIYPSKLKSYLYDMQLVRNQADYSGESVTRKAASMVLAKSQEFSACIEKEIEK